jgi:cobalt-zinc-cadmium efflux system membrane fusion protein
MTKRAVLVGLGLLGALSFACSEQDSSIEEVTNSGHVAEETAEVKGPHRGRMLTSADFTLELSIFERGVAPEFRAWVARGGRSISPDEVELSVRLTRLGGHLDQISFSPQGDFLRGNKVVYEPHSFEVSIEAVHAGDTFSWQYENFEGRTRIAQDVAESLGVHTAIAGPGVLKETVTVYGRVDRDPERVREIRARFDGVVRKVHAQIGGTVRKGDKLLTVESDESLNSYDIVAPIGGVITQRDANAGEQTSGRLLLTITDTSSVWVELSVFPRDRTRARVGASVSVTEATGGESVIGVISMIDVLAGDNQAVVARVVLKNPDRKLLPGSFVKAAITVGEDSVPLRVERSALQAFRDFTVVYAQVGEEYEVRMLELGREGGKYVEVLGGLDPGTRYVTQGSYLIKADIEKSGASHDH